MEKKINKIGVVFADETEFNPFKGYMLKYKFSDEPKRGNDAYVIRLERENDILELHCVNSGMGKVCSATAAAFLIADDGVETMLNLGFAGAVSGLRRGMTVVGTSYCEVDFDLSPIGYEPGQKLKDAPVKIVADEALLKKIKLVPYIAESEIGSGDFFLCDSKRKEEIVKQFRINSFDMESAAIAGVCAKQGVPFAAIRKISDDAAEGASEKYRDMAYSNDISLSKTLMDLVDFL